MQTCAICAKITLYSVAAYIGVMQRTVSVIDLSAIANNVRRMRGLAGGAKFYAVVKADAYGHGAERVALHIERLVDGFCVAITEEGAALRIAGVTAPILVLTPVTSRDDAAEAAFYGLDVSVNGSMSAALCCGLNCHIKLNTGMNRYGCNMSELRAVLDAAKAAGGRVSGLYSHLYCPHVEACRNEQLKIFDEAERLVKAEYPRAVCHLAATAGTMLGGKFIKDGVRCGISLYGYAPQGFSRKGLRPALAVYARMVQRTGTVGSGAGYAVAKKPYGQLSAYRAGCAAGFMRTVPLGEGNLCMDAFVSERKERLLAVFTDADEYAARCGTISYEALCSVTRRSERVYIS